MAAPWVQIKCKSTRPPFDTQTHGERDKKQKAYSTLHTFSFSLFLSIFFAFRPDFLHGKLMIIITIDLVDRSGMQFIFALCDCIR